ncbi:hypothetical protein EDB81DRAFT_887901 [Dactylonectria macrodidyma]|uniref:Uncharacterized protein n=1 Tax=Dactylonectria macrodidyma TaxID=307937 RepID=A0A9P9E6F9_9HYPO|nr:hypothetical protein EDB81DRAFT_887901 [Dactylonectria macrodidyma]
MRTFEHATSLRTLFLCAHTCLSAHIILCAEAAHSLCAIDLHLMAALDNTIVAAFDTCLQTPQKDVNKAPTTLSKALSDVHHPNLSQLRKTSPKAWFRWVIVSKENPNITGQINQLDISKIDELAGKIEKLKVHESVDQLYHHTFHTSDRGQARRKAYGFPLYEGRRKRRRLESLDSEEQQEQQHEEQRQHEAQQHEERQPQEEEQAQRSSFELLGSAPRLTPQYTIFPCGALSNHCDENVLDVLDAMEASEIYPNPQSEANARQDKSPKADVLPSVFPQRTCDRIVKRGSQAGITVSLTDPSTSTLNIEIIRDKMPELAADLFDKRVRYGKTKAEWVVEFDDGTDMTVTEWKLERVDELRMQRVLGNFISMAIHNDPQRISERDVGDSLTRRLTLSADGNAHSPGLLQVITDAAVMRQLENQLGLM